MELWQWAIAIIGATMVGISKTGVAGLGILAVAVFTLALPARDAVGTVLLVLIAGDIFAVSTYRRQADWSQLIKLFPWAALGVVVGALALGRVDEQALRKLLGAILAGLVAFQLVRRAVARQRPAADQAPQRRWVAALTGVTAGFTTMVANAAGPVMTIYLLAMDLPKLTFIGTTAWYFFVINLFKVPFSAYLGLINAASVPVSLALMPFAVVGGIIGRRVVEKIDQRTFESIALWLTLVAAVRLLAI